MVRSISRLALAFRSCVPLVIELFTFCQTDFYLHTGILEIEGQRDQRIAVLLDPAVQPHNFPFVHQQPPVPPRLSVKDVPFFVGGNVHAVDEKLSVLYLTKGVFQIHPASADGFHFGAAQFNPGLIFVLRCSSYERRRDSLRSP